MSRLTPLGSSWLAFFLWFVAGPAAHGPSREKEGKQGEVR